MGTDVLEVLRKARAILATNFCKWTLKDDAGNHCAIGAIRAVEPHCEAVNYFDFTWTTTPAQCSACAAQLLTNEAARRMFPQYAGQRRPRDDMFVDAMTRAMWDAFIASENLLYDTFDTMPTVFVNNQLGQEAILAVFDDAIAHEELRRLYAEVEREQMAPATLPEPATQPEPVPA